MYFKSVCELDLVFYFYKVRILMLIQPLAVIFPTFFGPSLTSTLLRSLPCSMRFSSLER